MLDRETVERQIEEFKADLRTLDPLQVAQRRILHGDALALPGGVGHELRDRIAGRFAVHRGQVLVVGSGKLGFSIAPEKRYRPFGEQSDIDVAIAAPGLFEDVWDSAVRYKDQGGYWERLPDFQKYLFRGWIRPDKLPPAENFQFGRDWFEFFNQLSASGDFGPYRIAGALYMSPRFLEQYQVRAVTGCADALRSDANEDERE